MRTVFEWLDGHPHTYWTIACLATLALLGWIGGGFRALARERAARGGEWIFAGLLLAFLAAWRWPYLFCASEYNPDESQFIAGAMALTRDPVFWRSVDGVTSGPLDFYALLPLHWLGVPLDYFGARVTALVLTWLTLLLVYRILRAAAAPAVAQLGTLGGAVFFAAASAPDFVHYSSELTPIALLALAILLMERRPLLAAFVAGWLPWAKLQAAPFSVAVVGWLLWESWRAQPALARVWQRAATLIAVAAAPTLVVLALVAAFGQWEHFFRRFILQNIAYVGGGLPAETVMRDMLRFARESGHFFPWLAATALFLVLGGLLHLRRRIEPPARLVWFAALLVLTAGLCIATPARSSLHYLFFLVLPLTLWSGVLLCNVWALPPVRRGLVVLALLCALTPLAVRVTQPAPHMLGQLADHWRRPYTPIGQVLRHWQPQGARLALWGWMSFAYVEGGLPQATSDTVSQWCILPVVQRDYYQAAFLSDMKRNQPEVFLDAVGPGAPFFDNRVTQAHEIDPALTAYLQEHYSLVVDLQMARIYVRNDFLAQHPLPASELQRRVSLGRLDYGTPVPADAKTPAYLPVHRIDGVDVTMIEPPAELLWHLKGNERSLRVNFGMHPKSYTEGASDGAEFIGELRMPGQPPLQILHRLLDPRQQAGDRGPLSAEVDLPPFPPGSDLVVRTTVGKEANNSWDWVYFNALRFSRSPFYHVRQFPGFRRPPNRVDAAYPYLVRHNDETLLMLPPPAALTFVLDGNERQLNFTYGLQEGSYKPPGQSDGVIYRVDLERDGTPARNIFDRHLTPLGVEADRGRQYADLMLPTDIQAGDRIVIRLDPGPSASWDWSYLAALDLR